MTTRYHPHFGVQYSNGVVGSIIINGPASLPYDIDLGVFPISDWYYGGADTISSRIEHTNGAPPPSDNVLFNGSNINPKGAGGQYYRVPLMSGKKYLLRLINPSTENMFTVSLVNHQFSVIATDFVPVVAFTTSLIFMGIGQRYDVVITANQAIGNYWFNVTFSATGACGGSNNPAPAAIFSYVGASSGLPTIAGTAPADTFCADRQGFSPVVQRSVPHPMIPSNISGFLNVTFNANANPTVFWNVNANSMQVTWGTPTLEYVRTGNTAYPARENIVSINSVNVVRKKVNDLYPVLTCLEWTVWVINNLTPIPHPMHLHVSCNHMREGH